MIGAVADPVKAKFKKPVAPESKGLNVNSWLFYIGLYGDGQENEPSSPK
jgi:hypothetical protein